MRINRHVNREDHMWHSLRLHLALKHACHSLYIVCYVALKRTCLSLYVACYVKIELLGLSLYPLCIRVLSSSPQLAINKLLQIFAQIM